MPEWPDQPISPTEFMEEFVPAALAETEIPEEADVKLGVRLDGEEGGEWLVTFRKGETSVRRTTREEAVLTLIQTVEDWRGALWQGMGGEFGRQASALFAGGSNSEAREPVRWSALSALGALDGMIRIRVTGGEAGDWSTGFKLGPGEVPGEPTTDIEISAEDARAMQEGTLDPMQAFMSGKIRVTGDMALMMQMQAVMMAAGN